VSPCGVEHEMSFLLEFWCTNNLATYEVLLSGLVMLVEMGARDAEIFGHWKLVVQQITGESQCLDGVLNEYRERCMDILDSVEGLTSTMLPRDVNVRANVLAQHASGYEIKRKIRNQTQADVMRRVSYTGWRW
jgi:ribonuclease HI